MKLLTRKEAAEVLRISVYQLDRLAKAKKIKRVRVGDSERPRILFRDEDLETFVKEHLE